MCELAEIREAPEGLKKLGSSPFSGAKSVVSEGLIFFFFCLIFLCLENEQNIFTLVHVERGKEKPLCQKWQANIIFTRAQLAISWISTFLRLLARIKKP